jgi:putative iron-regulated protein
MRLPTVLALLCVAGCVAGCSGPDPEAQVVKQYTALVSANYQDVVVQLQGLQAAVDSFVAAPSADGLAAVQAAWLAARPSYGQCEMTRFYGGPIDQAQGRMDEWPIDETFIDYTASNPSGGIINDPANYPILTPVMLATSDEKGGIENLSTGFHAIEFLLWGQRPDLSAGPGTRPFTDYVDGGTAANQDRRRTYLKSATDLLLADMQSLAAQWDTTDPGSYASQLLVGAPHDGVTKILRGLSNMAISELFYERMDDPFVTMARKDEQSCFSESTQVDLDANALGVQNAYLGHYGAVSGPSLAQLVAAKNPALDQQMQSELQAIVDAIGAIPPPFDHAVIAPATSDAHQAVQAAIDAFTPLQPTIDAVAAALNVTINL